MTRETAEIEDQRVKTQETPREIVEIEKTEEIVAKTSLQEEIVHPEFQEKEILQRILLEQSESTTTKLQESFKAMATKNQISQQARYMIQILSKG